jgi:hypothetical protein
MIKKQILSEEFKRMQELAGIITEMPKIVDPNSLTYISKVDWYYIDEYSDYPGMKGGVVPDAEGYESPEEYEGAELYIPKGTTGQVEDDKFIDEEGNDVPFIPEYFSKF